MKRMMKIISRQFTIAVIGFTAAAALFGLGMGKAHATLIGDPQVVIDGFFNTTLLASDTVAVVENTAEISCPGPHNLCVQVSPSSTGFLLDGESINIEAASILINLVGDQAGFPAGSFVGLVFSDLDWTNGPGAIIGVTLDTDIPGLDESRVSFGPDSVSINFESLVFAPGYALIELQTSHPDPVPEPSTVLLLSTGLVGLLGYGWNRRKLVSDKSNELSR